MGVSLEHLDGHESLEALRSKIRMKETAGFELITLARGQVQGQSINCLTFRDRPDNRDPGDVLLVPVASTGGREVQETVLDDGEDGGHRLISYAAVLVSNREVNVAVYRV